MKTSSVKKKYSSFKAATAIEGWHIEGLRVWPKVEANDWCGHFEAAAA